MVKNSIGKKVHNFIFFLIGLFIVALSYNTFLKPNSLVVGGTTGLSVIAYKLFGIKPDLFILSTGIILLLVCYIFLGFQKTKHNVLGTLIYPVMISLTAPIADIIIPYLKLDDFIVLVILGASCFGFGYGLVYKMGYTTGGFDVVIQLMNKYAKMPEGKANIVLNVAIVLISLPIIGVRRMVYSAILIVTYGTVVSKITIGISDSKLFFVYTRKLEKVRDALIKEGSIGFTIIPTIGGYSHYKGEMLMCVVDTKDYYEFKEIVLNIDKNAFLVINDCYEVNGGYKRQHLPFL